MRLPCLMMIAFAYNFSISTDDHCTYHRIGLVSPSARQAKASACRIYNSSSIKSPSSSKLTICPEIRKTTGKTFGGFVYGSVNKLIAAFSHPDYTVGTGITPDHLTKKLADYNRR